jgi:microcystin-dependent protein
MGSGCKQTPISNFCVEPVSSNCVLYKGDPVPVLGICTGDTITEVEKSIIDKIQEMLAGTGITLTQVTLENCQYLNQLFANKDKTVSNLIQLLVDSQCSLKGVIDQINQKINQTGNNFVFDLKCIPSPSESTIDGVVQAIINAHCLLKADFEALKTNSSATTIISQVVNSLISDLISGPTGVKKTVTNGVVHYSLLGMVPIGAVIIYDGPLSNFDASGKGLPNTEVANWHLCNGNGNTRDLRGVVTVGAIQGVGGGTLSANVDPTANNDATMNYSVQDRGGVAKVALTANQNGPHAHPVVDPGHSHPYTEPTKFANADKGGTPDYVAVKAGQTGKSTTGITIANSGSGEKHENRMPYEAVLYIKRIA